LPSLFGIRCRLPTSATALSTCGQLDHFISALEPRRDGDLDLLPFLCHLTPSPYAEAVRCGEPRFVRSFRPQCWFLLVAQVCPTVMPTRPPHVPTTCAACTVVGIDVHGSKDRVKDASPVGRMRRFSLRALGAYALWRMLTTFPSSAPFWTFAVTGA